MNDAILWSVWAGILVTLPVVITRMLIKNAMAVTRRRVSSRMKRGSEVSHETF